MVALHKCNRLTEILSTLSLLQPSLSNNFSAEFFHAGSQVVLKMKFYMQIDKNSLNHFLFIWLCRFFRCITQRLRHHMKRHNIVIFSAVLIQQVKNEIHIDYRRKSFLLGPFTVISTGHTHCWAHVFPRMPRRVYSQRVCAQPGSRTASRQR